MSSKRFSLENAFTPQMKRLSLDDTKEYKQSIYDKTIKLLYKGSKSNPEMKLPVMPCISVSKNLESCEQRHLKQIVLDKNCKLDSKRAIYNFKEYNSTTLFDKCSFCERLSCFTNLCQCTQCLDYFCDRCSLIKYTKNEESRICLSCFK